MGTLSLGEFVVANPPAPTGSEAWITTIPEWDEIRTAWQAGSVTQAQVRRWLIEERVNTLDRRKDWEARP
jgi:hypothetical protein